MLAGLFDRILIRISPSNKDHKHELPGKSSTVPKVQSPCRQCHYAGTYLIARSRNLGIWRNRIGGLGGLGTSICTISSHVLDHLQLLLFYYKYYKAPSRSNTFIAARSTQRENSDFAHASPPDAPTVSQTKPDTRKLQGRTPSLLRRTNLAFFQKIPST